VSGQKTQNVGPGAAVRVSEELSGASPRDAIAALVDREGPRLYALGLRFCGNATDATDLVQETFLEALKSWGTFRGDAKPSTWLYRIAARTCQRMKHKAHADRELPAEGGFFDRFSTRAAPGTLKDDGSPLDIQINREMIERVQQAILSLPLEYRIPIVMKEIVGFSVAEVAEITGMPEGTVKTRLHRGRLRIADALSGALPTADEPPPRFEQGVCMDLLMAKQDALDRDVPFPMRDDQFCRRCASVFATMDLAGDVCKRLGEGRLPDELRRELIKRLESGEEDGA